MDLPTSNFEAKRERGKESRSLLFQFNSDFLRTDFPTIITLCNIKYVFFVNINILICV